MTTGLEARSLTYLAREYREALEEFKHEVKDKTLVRFPYGCSGDVSRMLVQFLKEEGYETSRFVSGSHHTLGTHAWVICDDLIVDITADQFKGSNVDNVYVGFETNFHRQFTGRKAGNSELLVSDGPTYDRLRSIFWTIGSHLRYKRAGKTLLRQEVVRISRLSLEKQAQQLGIQIEEYTSRNKGKPELLAKEIFTNKGWYCCEKEGLGIKRVMTALMFGSPLFNVFADLSAAEDYEQDNPIPTDVREDLEDIFLTNSYRCLLWHFSYSEKRKENRRKFGHLIEPTKAFMRSMDLSTYLSNIQMIRRKMPEELRNNVDWNFCKKAFHPDIVETYVRIFELGLEDYDCIHAGWPDLTLVREGELRFVEVKTTDKLLFSQIEALILNKSVFKSRYSIAKIKKG
jgi:hypothetical protein